MGPAFDPLSVQFVSIHSRQELFQNLFISKYVCSPYEIPKVSRLGGRITIPLGHHFGRARRQLMWLAANIISWLPVSGAFLALRQLKFFRGKKKCWIGLFRFIASNSFIFMELLHLVSLPAFLTGGLQPPSAANGEVTCFFSKSIVFYHPMFKFLQNTLFSSRWRLRLFLSYKFHYERMRYFNMYVDFLRFWHVPLNRRVLNYLVDWDRYVLYSGKTWESP